MEHIAITAEPRPEHLTKGARKALRQSGHILASVYGKGIESVSVILSASDLARVLNTETGTNTLVDLTIGKTKRRQLARLSAIEMEPITHYFRHVGLHVIQSNQMQKANVPIQFVGEAEAMHNHTGLLEPGVATVEIQAMPESLVGHLTVDVSQMEIGDVLHASDLPLPPKVNLLSDPALPIASLRLMRDTMTAEERELNEDDETLVGVTRDSSSIEESLMEV